jgi:RNA polymerase sigma-70 factor (ECF subfamily)
LALQPRSTSASQRDSESAQALESNTGKPKPGELQIDWGLLVSQIKAGEEEGMEQLYKIFQRGIRYYLCRQVGPQDLNDRLHDTFVVIISAIRRGDLREPKCLMGFVRTVVRRQVASYIEEAVRSRRDVELEDSFTVLDRALSPEERSLIEQRAALIEDLLASLPSKAKEILVRFYLKEETKELICQEMGLTMTQFILLKSRAKARFGEIGRRKLASV